MALSQNHWHGGTRGFGLQVHQTLEGKGQNFPQEIGVAALLNPDFLIRIGNLGNFLVTPRKRVWHLFLFCRSGSR